MMQLLNYYLGRRLTQSILMVFLIVAGLDYFIQCLREFHHINDYYPIQAALLYVTLNLPGDLYHLFPTIALIGTLIGLASMIPTRELLMMQVSGRSFKSMLIPIGITVILLTVGMLIIGETLAPSLNKLAMNNKIARVNQGKTLPTSAGIWVKNGNDFIHITHLLPHGMLNKVSRYHLDSSGQLIYVARAETGYFKGKTWQLHSVTQNWLNKNTMKVKHYASQVWPLHFNPEALMLASINPDQHSLYQLYTLLFHKNKGIAHKTPQLHFLYHQFWQRLLQPALILLMVMLAVPFVILRPYQQTKMASYASILIGLMIGLTLYGLSQVMW